MTTIIPVTPMNVDSTMEVSMFDMNASHYQFSDGTYDLKSMTFEEIHQFFEFLSESPLRAQRTFQALWQTGVDELSEMRTVAPPVRDRLAEVAGIKKDSKAKMKRKTKG